jgi:hypothetical protein
MNRKMSKPRKQFPIQAITEKEPQLGNGSSATWRLLRLRLVRKEPSAVEEGVLGSRGRVRVAPLPGERRAEEGERLAGAGGRLEERVRLPLPPRSVQRGDDPPHEHQLRPVRCVGELHWQATHVVHAGPPGPLRARCGSRQRRWRRGEVVGIGYVDGAHRRRRVRFWAGGIGGKSECRRKVAARQLSGNIVRSTRRRALPFWVCMG